MIMDLTDQSEVRNKLKQLIIRFPKRGDILSKDIGIAYITLMKFLRNENVSLKTLSKIIAWIEKKQNEITNRLMDKYEPVLRKLAKE